MSHFDAAVIAVVLCICGLMDEDWRVWQCRRGGRGWGIAEL